MTAHLGSNRSARQRNQLGGAAEGRKPWRHPWAATRAESAAEEKATVAVRGKQTAARLGSDRDGLGTARYGISNTSLVKARYLIVGLSLRTTKC